MAKIFPRLSSLITSAGLWLLAGPAALAQVVPGDDPTGILGPAQSRSKFTIDDLIDLIQTITSWVLIIVGLIGVVFLLYGAFAYITSGGDPEKVGSAKKIIIYALIGIAVAILAFAIVSFVASIIV